MKLKSDKFYANQDCHFLSPPSERISSKTKKKRVSKIWRTQEQDSGNRIRSWIKKHDPVEKRERFWRIREENSKKEAGNYFFCCCFVSLRRRKEKERGKSIYNRKIEKGPVSKRVSKKWIRTSWDYSVSSVVDECEFKGEKNRPQKKVAWNVASWDWIVALGV